MRRVLAWTIHGGVLAFAMTTPACIADLAEARQCPPAPQIEGSDCGPVLANPPALCFGPAEFACLRGPVTTCTCVNDECPTAADACFPDGDCPPAVLTDARPDAQCMRLGQAELGRGLPSESQCLCGCAGCAAVCDGYGPIMGVTTAPDEVAAMLIDVGAHMPDAGMFGLYIRARGVANFNVVLFKGDTTDLTMLDEQLIADPIYPVVSLGREFKEHVLYRDIGIKPYAWATAADKPTLVAIIPVGADGNALALAELDCIVPFVTPSEQISPD